MSNEARITSGLQLTGPLSQKFNTQYNFQADIHAAGGPAPGEFLATKLGKDVDLSAFTQPGWALLYNLGVDAAGNDLSGTAGQQYTWTNYVEYGLFDHTTSQFYPLGELLPGEGVPIRLSRFLNTEIGTGSGTGKGVNSVTFRFKAIGTASKVIVLIFER